MTNSAVDRSGRTRRPAGIRSLRLGYTRVSFVPDGDVRLPPRGWLPDTTDEVWAEHPEYLNRWLLLGGLLLAVVVAIASRIRRWRTPAALGLLAVVVLLVLADGHAARADAVALRIVASGHCDEPMAYNVSYGWFDWSPLGP
ncbi:hypothetical protein [Streptomyces sp. NPDC008150]|uniref:hypothetical protein n=1 Tax=Streptomyces sp. NPDC008150 TaxID=3364816 RepID=UPI0036DFEF05